MLVTITYDIYAESIAGFECRMINNVRATSEFDKGVYYLLHFSILTQRTSYKGNQAKKIDFLKVVG